MDRDYPCFNRACAAFRENDRHGVRKALKQALRQDDSEQANAIMAFCYENMHLPPDDSTERLLRLACVTASYATIYDLTIYMSLSPGEDEYIENARRTVRLLTNVQEWLKSKMLPAANAAIAQALTDTYEDLRGVNLTPPVTEPTQLASPPLPPPPPPKLTIKIRRTPSPTMRQTRSGRISKPTRRFT